MKLTAVRIGVVGAGIIGLAVARRLTEVRPDIQVDVIEKEADVARHQTGRNSGVAHAGLYYPPGSLKAQLCTRGRQLLADYCAERGLPYDECGKVVVATDESELDGLHAIEQRARANGVPGLKRLGPGELAEVEPHAVGVAALHSPHTAIVDFVAVARALASDVIAAGGAVHFGCEVDAISPAGGTVRVHAGDRAWNFDRVVVCAGLHADRLARLAGDGQEPQIVPFRGEYLRLVTGRSHLVRGLIYPVPDPRYPFLGVHFTRRVNGSVDVGPNAVLALAREGYVWTDLRARDVFDTVRFPGFRRMAARHWRAGAYEIWGSVWRPAFVARARRYVPEVRLHDVERAPSGVRAQALDGDGALVDDFRIGRVGRVVTVRNAPSPAATSSLAIAEHLVPGVLED
ncbi:MAG: L-2-hydroxyglutarate oxidase [Acidimicrobiaceae bacterium]|nr:L-2-hydroxyglutarate oxidase [Acidimicrobiaceae bacterium]